MSTQEVENQHVGYETPPICDLLTLLLKNRRPSGAYNQVWPNIYISDAPTARDKMLLRHLGITHVVNAAHGPAHIDTGADFYSDTNVEYYGVEAPDRRDFDITPYFYPTASFIYKALSQQREEKVLVHCARGVSRSATLVLAYLMIREKLTVAEAIDAVCAHRNILPNAGFLQQLRQLDSNLNLRPVVRPKQSTQLSTSRPSLMIYENMTVVDAIDHVKRRRRVIPNWGFLKQLRELDTHLHGYTLPTASPEPTPIGILPQKRHQRH